MATLTINGQKVTVDDSFRNLSPEQQEATVNEIASQMGSTSPESVNPWVDAGASFASGVGRGAGELAMLPATAASALTSGSDWLADKIVGGARSAFGYDALPPEETASGRDRSGTIGAGLDAGQHVARSLMDANLYAPKTTVGEYAETAGEFVPGALLPGATVGNALRFGVVPGLASEAAGQLTEGSSAEPYARVSAALLAPAAPALATRLISPNSGMISPARAAAVDTLRAEGVNPTAGQILGSQRLRATEQELGGFTQRQLMDGQQEAYTNAAMSRAGGSGLATPENMAETLTKIGDKMDNLASRTKIGFDSQLQTDLLDDAVNYQQMTGAASAAPVVEDFVTRINNVAQKNNGVIPGENYKAFRTELGNKAQKTSDQAIKSALRDMQESLDDAVARSMPQDFLPEWQSARKDYRNFITVERAANGAGEAAAGGVISPAKLRAATIATQGRRNYTVGNGDFSDLTRAGEQVLTSPPNSGTALRLDARTLGGLTTGSGAGAGALMSGAGGAVVGALLGAAAPAIAGRALMSQPVQSYLVNQLAPRMFTIDPRTLAVIQGLITNQEAR